MAKMQSRLPEAAKVYDNPSPEELKALAATMPNARRTAFGNLNVHTEVVSRSKRSTFIVTDEPDGQNQAIPRDEYLAWVERQDAYIAGREMVVVDGYIGHDPEFRVAARLYIEASTVGSRVPGFVTKWPNFIRFVRSTAIVSSGVDSCQRTCESYVQP